MSFWALASDRVHPSTSQSERMTSFVDISIWLGQVVPSDILGRLSLDLIRIAHGRRSFTSERAAAVRQ